MAKLFYYGDKISPNMTKTPEGFLICQNVPIGRTGVMQYQAQELGINAEDPETLINVNRDEADVFEQAVLASFEGKPVTDGHPNEDVEPHNYYNYAKGHLQNVRRGIGEEADKIVADLHITDPTLINQVENNIKRQVSCGYACDYIENPDGTYSQKKIRGNHVAVVDEGRAGKTVSIKDAMPLAASETIMLERSRPLMSKKQSKITGVLNLFARSVRDAKSTDEIEEMAQDAAEAIDSCLSGSDEFPPVSENVEKKEAEDSEKKAAEDVQPEGAPAGGDALLAAIVALTAAVEKMGAKPVDEVPVEEKPENPKEEIDALLDELIGDAEEKGEDGDPAEEEASVTVPSESMDEAADETPVASKDAAIAILKSARPAIAAIKDPAERKRVSDALVKSIRGQIESPMAKVLDATKSAAAKQAQDTKVKDSTFDIEAQQSKYDALNPHNHKKEVK